MLRPAAFPILLSALLLWQCDSPPATRASGWADGLARLDASLAHLESLCVMAGPSVRVPDSTLQLAFEAARLVYKESEYLWEYAFPVSAVKLNGPAIDEVERDCDHSVVPAEGFQVLEESLYPHAQGKIEDLAALVGKMRAVLAEVSRAQVMEPQGTSLVHRPLAWTDSSVLDAMRLELVRIAFLSLSGFDSPIARRSLPETRAALEGIAAALSSFASGPADALRNALAVAAAAAQGDFASFDRAAYLTGYLNPAYAALAEFQRQVGAPFAKDPRPFPADAGDLLSAPWNPKAFGPPFAQTPAQVDLGRELFFDPVLSGNGGRACATCHDPDLAFGDGLRKNHALDGKRPLARHTPSLLHAGFQRGAFWDLRAESLEDQASMVIHNPEEMGGSLAAAVASLQADPHYAARFLSAFAADTDAVDRDMPVTALRVRRALAAYVRSLAPFDSPWDRYARGESVALSHEARAGFNLFMGKAQCGTCHFPPLFNGSVPPLYLSTDLEVLGVPAGPGLKHPRPDADSGRMAVDKVLLNHGAFKTPTVRNAEFTAPYMHNGAFATLEEVVDFYDAGGGAGLGLEVPNQTLSPDSLRLTAGEKKSLVAFMKSLSDTAGTTARPAPRALAARAE